MSTRAAATSTWWATEFLRSSWPFQPRWTTAATAQTECKYTCHWLVSTSGIRNLLLHS